MAQSRLYASPPHVSELRKLFPMEDSYLPPAPVAAGRTTTHSSRRPYQPSSTPGWNASTQLATTLAKPLKHQILCRNFEPPPPVQVEQANSKQLLARLSKGTISSRLKGNGDKQSIEEIEKTARKERRQYQRKQSPERTKGADDGEDAVDTRGKEAIQLLLYYRREVEKRLRADAVYLVHEQR